MRSYEFVRTSNLVKYLWIAVRSGWYITSDTFFQRAPKRLLSVCWSHSSKGACASWATTIDLNVNASDSSPLSMHFRPSQLGHDVNCFSFEPVAGKCLVIMWSVPLFCTQNIYNAPVPSAFAVTLKEWVELDFLHLQYHQGDLRNTFYEVLSAISCFVLNQRQDSRGKRWVIH